MIYDKPTSEDMVYENQPSFGEPDPSSSPIGESEAEGDLEYYFSCHERMIRDYNRSKHSSTSDVFGNINKDELRDIYTMPDLSRSTLVDQIDYDLINFKVNESSMVESFSDSDYGSNHHANCSNLRENKLVCEDVTPKLMGFLNKEKITKNSIIKFHK